ncbi:hypothetical protein [Bacillus massiliigorillae]|uniref:hypothetical protein n=1 Tax=Bacillus massiliigorillae TaxID=1243664 RepID=UPI0003A0C03D|nr:hypothetical protein [Bacillus massiliigorillae]
MKLYLYGLLLLSISAFVFLLSVELGVVALGISILTLFTRAYVEKKFGPLLKEQSNQV